MANKKTLPVKRGASQTFTSQSGSPDQWQVLNQGLQSLYQATEELQFNKPLSTLLKSILRGLKAGTSLQHTAVFVYDEAGEVLKGAAGLGPSERKVTEMVLPLENGEEDQLLQLNLFRSPDDSQAARERIGDRLRSEFGWKNVDLIPLEIRDHLVGLLAYESGPEILALQEIIVLFARQAAYIIENAKLFSQVEEMALRDTLTGLYNRRYLLQILEYELNRARRYKQPLSVIFVDLDHFKEVNDTCGHAMGDRLLKQVAGKLSSLFRTTDVVGRYAGDEFLAVLPSTHPEGALILAERILQALKGYEMMVRGRSVKVSVSIGLDTYEGEEGVGSATLIDRADKAMYEAKAGGRSRVHAFKAVEKILA